MLLRPIDGPGWPRDYLLARVHGNLAQLPAAPAGDPWPPLLAAGRRLYPVLDPDWRREFGPLAALLEVRALATALRLQQGDGNSTPSLLGSLLHPQLLAAVGKGLPALTSVLGLPPDTDIRALEATLFDRELLRGRASCREPALQLLLQSLIDLRNLLAVQKALRWGSEALPSLLAGGATRVSRWENAWRRRSPSELQHLAERLAPGDHGEPPSRLLADLGRTLARRARDPLDAAVLLHYGWQLRRAPALATVGRAA